MRGWGVKFMVESVWWVFSKNGTSGDLGYVPAT